MEFLKSWSVTMAHSLLLRSSRLLRTSGKSRMIDLTSPYHPQPNGRAESAVKMAKPLMKKTRHSKSDFYLMLLEYRNTPTQVLGTTPAQRMLCRTIRSRLRAKAATREQKPVDMKHLTEQVGKAQRKQERTYNRVTKRLAPLSRGQAVRTRHRGIWEQGTIERQEGGKGRLYVVWLTTGGFVETFVQRGQIQ